VVPVARSLNHLPALVPALAYQGLHHSFRGEYAEAEADELQAVQLASDARDGFHLALSLFYLGITQANQGRPSDALATLNGGWNMAKRNNNRMLLSRMPNALGWIYRELNDPERSVELNRTSLEYARQSKTLEAEANALINLAYAYLDLHAPDLAVAALDDAAPLFDHDPWHRWRFFDIRHAAAAAECALAQRRLDPALDHASRLRGSAIQHQARKYQAEAQCLLGRIFFSSGDYERAAADLRSGLDVLRDHPAPLVAWRLWASLAETLFALDDRDAGRQ